ncbi:MAG: hypothetical protein XXXJIFNMEKO3_01798 [Candidatus Erwinia impunctatus]|nr:hypothetical protein XXXJIFNMEKO_01798 [Culicoides impunctatus]
MTLTGIITSHVKTLYGIVLTLAIAAAAMLLSQLPAIRSLGLGSLTLAIFLGMLAGNTVYPLLASSCETGVHWVKQHCLKLGIILYGFYLTVQQITDVGFSGMLIDLSIVISTFSLACLVGKCMGIDKLTYWLIGAGSSICGAAAILATAPVVQADNSKPVVAVSTVVVFGTMAIVLYPALYSLILQLYPAVTATQWGIFTGSTIHEVAQVAAAGHAINAEVENSAVITKMLRVMLLAPFLLLLGLFIRRRHPGYHRQSGNIPFPWFALLFIAVVILNSMQWFSAPVITIIRESDNFLLTSAMAALGLSTQLRILCHAGIKPMLLGAILFIWLVVGGGTINLLLQQQ